MIISCFLAMAGISSCTIENELGEPYKVSTIKATDANNLNVRTALNGYNVTWTTNDVLSFYNNDTQENKTFTLRDGEAGKSTGMFDADKGNDLTEGQWIAYYPKTMNRYFPGQNTLNLTTCTQSAKNDYSHIITRDWLTSSPVTIEEGVDAPNLRMEHNFALIRYDIRLQDIPEDSKSALTQIVLYSGDNSQAFSAGANFNGKSVIFSNTAASIAVNTTAIDVDTNYTPMWVTINQLSEVSSIMLRAYFNYTDWEGTLFQTSADVTMNKNGKFEAGKLYTIKLTLHINEGKPNESTLSIDSFS